MAFLLSFFINFFLTYFTIKFASKVQNPVRDFIPKTENDKLKISPFGGIAFFISGFFASVFLVKDITNLLILIPAFLLLILGAIDDFKKIFYKNYKGVSAKFKIIWQGAVSVLVCIICYYYNKNFNSINLIIPFYGMISFNFPTILTFIIPYFAFIGTTNAMNLTDGLDGLAGKQGFMLLIFLSILLYAVAFNGLIFNISDLKIIIFSFIGAIIAFLFFNTNPAKIFMGDAGSMALGAIIATFFILLKLELMLIFIGFIIFMEALSVVMQVSYFKLTKGKRIFKMSPIHHHFQLSGMKEQKITEIAFLITFVISIFFLTPFF